MDWRDLNALPRATAESWEARRVGGRLTRGKAAVDAAVAKWHLLDPLMVSPPGSARFLPVLHVEEYRHGAHRKLLRRHLASIAMLFAVAALLMVSGYLAERATALRAGAMAFTVAAFVAADYHLVIKRIEALSERALFALWICRAGTAYTLASAAAMLLVGGAQWYAEARLGGHEALLSALGAVHASVGSEPWRLLVGPFLHADLTHWLTNFAMLAIAGAIAGPLMSAARFAALFLGGSSFGALVSLLFEATAPTDVYVGVSAGIFALLGWCAGAAARRPASFPSRFAVTAASFALLNIAMGAFASPGASNVGHIAGVALGFVWGVSFPPPCRRA